MESDSEKKKDLNSLCTEKDKLINYAKKVEIQFYDPNNLIEKENIDDLICPICFYVFKNPLSCSDKKNSHSFCKECIKEYLNQNNNNKCPTCKLNFESKIKNELFNELNKIAFNCLYKNEGCNDIISYSEYLNHINNCKYSNYECLVKKYNNKNKEFIKCGFIDNKMNVENHLKLCALKEYNCIFCNENILQMNLEDHFSKKCKFGIINYPNGIKYIGEKNNNVKEGYGILYSIGGNRYEGEFKNDLIDGYGILYYNNVRYEGEFKSDKMEGYGIITILIMKYFIKVKSKII